MLTTASLAELFYRAAQFSFEKNTVLSESQLVAWKKVFPEMNSSLSAIQISLKFLSAGDAVMQRLYSHVKND